MTITKAQKNALVAGGAGFIGSHLCRLLLNKGYHVVIVDNFVTGRKENIQDLLDATQFKNQVSLVNVDICHPEFVSQMLAQFSGSNKLHEIYNLASPASPVDFKIMPVFILETGSKGTQNLLELAKQQQARVLLASTSEVYGDPLVHPQVETYFGNVNSIGARSCYDEAKRYAEAITMAYHRAHGVDTRIARIFNTYGPEMRPEDGRIIPNFFIQAMQGEELTIYGDGSQTRSFCFVSDMAAGLYALMQSSETTPVNIGNPIERTVKEIAVEIIRLTQSSSKLKALPLPENDPKMRRPDISKAGRVLGWQPQVGLEEGLQKTMAYFKKELARTERIQTRTV